MNINTLGQSSLALDSSDGGGTSRNGASSSAVTTPPFDEIYCPIYELFNEPLEICNSNNEYIIHCCGNFRQKKLCFKKKENTIFHRFSSSPSFGSPSPNTNENT